VRGLGIDAIDKAGVFLSTSINNSHHMITSVFVSNRDCNLNTLVSIFNHNASIQTLITLHTNLSPVPSGLGEPTKSFPLG